jgi:hypothetical protein
MPLAQVRFPKFSAPRCAAAGVLAFLAAVLLSVVLLAMALLTGCSTPKTAAVPAAKPSPAVVEAAGRTNPAKSGPGGHSGSAVEPDPFVAAVRAGTMSGYPQATIGQAFESAFSDVHWSSQQPKWEARVVTFTGLLPANMRPDCGAAKTGSGASPCAQDAKVTFEWSFASDGHLFHLSHVNPEAWPETHRSTRDMMLYIFG